MKMRRERNIQPRKRQDVRREDNNNKRKTKNRNIELRATSLGPKPFLPFLGGFLFCFVSFMLSQKSRFPLKKRVFLLIFECLPFFSLACLTSPSLSLSLYLSVSLSLSHVIFLPSSFLSSLSFFLSFLALFFGFCFMQRRTSTYYILKVVLINLFFVFLVSCFCLVFQIPFCYLCFLLWGPTSPKPALVWCVCVFWGFSCCFSFLCWFCVCVAFALFLVCIECPKRASYPTIHLASRGRKYLFWKWLFWSTKFGMYEGGCLEVK